MFFALKKAKHFMIKQACYVAECALEAFVHQLTGLVNNINSEVLIDTTILFHDDGSLDIGRIFGECSSTRKLQDQKHVYDQSRFTFFKLIDAIGLNKLIYFYNVNREAFITMQQLIDDQITQRLPEINWAIARISTYNNRPYTHQPITSRQILRSAMIQLITKTEIHENFQTIFNAIDSLIYRDEPATDEHIEAMLTELANDLDQVIDSFPKRRVISQSPSFLLFCRAEARVQDEQESSVNKDNLPSLANPKMNHFVVHEDPNTPLPGVAKLEGFELLQYVNTHFSCC